MCLFLAGNGKSKSIQQMRVREVDEAEMGEDRLSAPRHDFAWQQFFATFVGHL